MSARVVYVVMGSTGDYEDHHEWSVAAYTDRALAQEHQRLATAEEVRLRDWFAEGENYEIRGDEKLCPRNVYDLADHGPHHHFDIGKCLFYVDSVSLRTALPRVKRPKLPHTPEASP